MRKPMTFVTMAVMAAAAAAFAQTPTPARSPSPDGVASVQVGEWKPDDKPGARVANGKWIEILYGRPLKRGRADLWGTSETFGAAIKGGAAVWRAGANVLTRLRTEVPLNIGGKRVPPGEYTLFIDLKSRSGWTLIVSSQPAQASDDVPTRSKVWEAFVYEPEKDVTRAQMRVERLPYSVEQLTYAFTDVTGASGTLRLMWDMFMASVDFTVAR